MFNKLNLKPLAIDILIHLSRSPGKEFYLREISRATGGSLGGCHKSLKELLELGLVSSRKSGRNLYFRVNGANPAITHFKVFVSLLELKEMVDVLTPLSLKMVLFGSCASGTDTLDSDMDVMIVANDPGEARARLGSLELPRKIQAVVFTPAQLMKSREADPGFHAEVDKGIVLHRSQDERV